MTGSRRIARVDIDEYLAGEKVSEIRHEYVDGALFTMTGESRTHNRLRTNLAVRVGVHLEGGCCRAAAADMKVRPLVGERFYYPDLVVSCNDSAEEADEYVETRPTVLVEVLSPSTEQIDRREKRVAYQSIPTLREYVLVAERAREVSVYRRDGEDWLLDVLGAGERTTLDSIDFPLDVDDLYRGVNAVARRGDTHVTDPYRSDRDEGPLIP